MLEKRSLELDAPASRPSMYMKENRLPKKLKVPTAAGHTTIAHTPGPDGLVGRSGGGGQLQSGASGGSSAGVHGQVGAGVVNFLVVDSLFFVFSRFIAWTRSERAVQQLPRQQVKPLPPHSWCLAGGAPA